MLHVSYALHLQTETTSMDMDDSDDKVIQNTGTQSNVSINNVSKNVQKQLTKLKWDLIYCDVTTHVRFHPVVQWFTLCLC